MGTVQMHVELKGAQTRLERLKSERRVMERERAEIDQKIQAQDRKINEAEREVKRLQESVPVVVVSEHALLRYLERVKQIDMEEIKREILTPDVVRAITHFHGCSVPHPEGFTLRVRENTVTTIITEDSPDP